jgi:hypothetical protein
MRLVRWIYLVLMIAACNRSNVDEQPAFIQSGTVTLSTLSSQGSNSSAISELWFYADGDILGIVDTPSALPLLKQGNQTITVFPGIKNNGMGTSRIRYPFYSSYDTTVFVEPGNSYLIEPRFTYLSSAVIDATRNFETGNTFIAATDNQAVMELMNDPSLAASGVRCVRMTLPETANLLSYLDETNVDLEAGQVAFLEMDYSCNNTFVVGLYTIDGGNSTKVPVLYLTPTLTGNADVPQWNKIYMDLGMVASQYPNTDSYRIYVECTPSEAQSPVIYLDDIKIVK